MSVNNNVLVYCETSSGKLAPVTFELLGAGVRLSQASGGELMAALIGHNVHDLSAEIIAYGARKVYVVEDALLEHYSTEPFLISLEKIARQVNPGIILMGQTAAGRDLAPWLAFHLDTAATMDCIALEIDADTRRLLMTRPVYGGNAQAVQVCETDPQIATVRIKAMTPAVRNSNRRGDVINLSADIDPSSLRTHVIERKTDITTGVRLEEAKVVIAGGRGMGGADGFQQLEEIARLLKGAVGATRPPCDKKWISDNRQIGLTGKVVSPELYIAVGISGASQHLSGFSGARTIVAINKDPEANIFKAAHYGIVADWKTVLPSFAAKLKEITGTQ